MTAPDPRTGPGTGPRTDRHDGMPAALPDGRRTAEGIRARARRELTAEIKARAHRQLAESGPDGLSLRAIARALDMSSSAIYRYFASRDDLITALVIDAYHRLGQAAEEAEAAAGGTDPATRWLAVCRAVRQWALAHPHDYALIYGTPLPGYRAPQDTVPAAARVGMALVRQVADAARDRTLRLPDAELPTDLAANAERLRRDLGTDLPTAAIPPLIAAWAELFGLISFEVFGQFTRMIDARDALFDAAAGRLAESVGLTIAPVP